MKILNRFEVFGVIALAGTLLSFSGCKTEEKTDVALDQQEYPRTETLYIGGFDWAPPATFNPLDYDPNFPIDGNCRITYEALLAYNQLKGNEQYEMTAVEATGAFAEADLTAYDAIVVSSTLNNAEAIASLKEIRPYEPMLNLNAALYEVWGYGTLGDAHNFAVVKNINHALFSGLQLITEGMEEGMAGLPLTNVNPFQGVNLTSGPFENDEVLAAVMESETSVAIHAHNISHNGYLFIPYTQEALADAANPSILNNAIKIVMNSKAKVSAAPKPSIVQNYKNRNTFVSIKSSVPSPVIYYTIDGSEPTEQSTLYTEPFNIASEGVTVKAIAKGDGYLLSDVAEQLIDLKDQSASPVITATPHKGYTTITMDCPTEGVSIYYNYSNSTDSTVSSKYTGAITLMTDQTITAFAASAVYVQSEPASQSIEINMPVKFTEQLAHMDAAKDPYYSLLYDAEDKPNTDSNSKVAYFFSWGKSKTAYSYYDTNADPIGFVLVVTSSAPKSPSSRARKSVTVLPTILPRSMSSSLPIPIPAPISM